MFSLKLPHYIPLYTIFDNKKKITQDYSKSAAMEFFLWTQERVRNSRGKRAISVRAIEFLQYLILTLKNVNILIYTHSSSGTSLLVICSRAA